MFSSGVEERLELRLIVLALGWWVALSLLWVGSPAWVSVGGGALLSVGHAFSWWFRGWASSARSLMIGVAIVGALLLVPRTVSAASGGDWLPVAYFVLLFQGLTSFELRTRGGLYTSMTVSGVIFFLASQRALEASFGVFLVGFVALLLAFFAVSFLVDQVDRAEVRWFKHRYSFAWFWSGVLVASLSLALGIFLVLPKRFGDPVQGAQGVVLPIRADGGALPQPLGAAGPLASALPVGPQDGGAAGEAAAGDEESQEVVASSPSGGAAAQETGTAGDIQATPDPPDGTEGAGATAPSAGPGVEIGPDKGASAAPVPAAPDVDDSVVMQVRSPVLTYWRGRVFDTFDGSSWSVDPTSRFTSLARSARGAYRLLDGPGGNRRRIYAQTFFILRDAPSNTVFTGYAPWAADPPYGSGTVRLESGSVYRAVSVLPDFSGEALDRADARTRLDFRYHDASAATGGLGVLAREIVTGAFSDLERVQRIVNYLDGNYEFDGGAESQLALSTTPIEFLQRGSPGTSMDFATATVLLSRKVGVPARLTTGYLPGTFDPLSGTYVVRRSDRHAWAEVYLGRVGWVPFDSAPRADAAAFGEGGSFYSASVNRLFNAGWGDKIHDYLSSSPGRVNEIVTGALSGGTPAILALALAGSLATGVFIVWKVGPRIRWARRRLTYSRLDGDGRDDMVRIYLAAERLLRRAGLAARRPGETLADYAGQAGALLQRPMPDLAWLRGAAWTAAYDPGPYDAAALPEAEARLRRLRVDLKAMG